MSEIETVAEGLWRRVRDVVLAAERLERFTFAPDRPEAGPDRGWVRGLATDATLAEALEDLVRRAVAAGSDAVNHRILVGPDGEEGLPVAELARQIGTPPLAVSERITDLVQAGLASHDIERGTVRATAAGRGWLRVLEAITAHLLGRARAELPRLLAG